MPHLIAFLDVLTPRPPLLTTWLVFLGMGAALAAWFRFSSSAHWLQVPIIAGIVGGAVWDFSNRAMAAPWVVPRSACVRSGSARWRWTRFAADRGAQPDVKRSIARTLLSALAALAIAAGLVPVMARESCACTIKGPAYRAAMNSDLRDLVSAQEAFRADSGRFAAISDLVAMRLFRFSGSVQLVESSVSDSAYTVRLRHESLAPEMTCTVSVGNGPERDGEPVCGRFARERAHTRNGIIFFALLAIVLALRVGRAITGRIRFLSWRLLLLPLLAIAHPFWDVLRGHVTDHCSLISLDFLWIGLVAATAGYLFDGPEPPRAKAALPVAT